MNKTATSYGSRTHQKIQVLIVDDHAVMRTGLKFFLLAFDDLELVGEAASGEEAIESCSNLRPHVVLMDLLMSGMNGAETTQKIIEHWPQTKVIVLTNFQEAELVQEALQAGAIGYLLKNVSAEALADAIRSAHAGQPTLAPEATRALVQATRRVTLGGDLTNREKEVLTLMAAGQSNSDIAEKLMISLSTVKFHVSSILSKLDASSRAEAVALAWQHNLVTRL